MKISFRNAIGVVSILAAVGSVGCRHAGLSGCNASSDDAKILIRACTAAIESAGLSEADLSIAYLGRSRGYVIQGKTDLAVADMDTLLRLQPGNARAQSYRGYAHGQAHQWDLALSDALKVTELAPNVSWAWSDLGWVYQKNNDFPEAEQSLNRSIQLWSDNPTPWGFRCGLRAIVDKELDEAMADCERSLRLRPNDGYALYARGFVRFRKQQYAEAVKDFDVSIARNPKSAAAYYLRGLTKIAMGQSTGSADIAHAQSLEPKVAERFAGYGVPAVR